MKTWLFNPFVYVAGLKSLLAGWFIMIITAAAACFSYVHFDGVIDAHFGKPSPWRIYFIEGFTDWFCAAIIFYLSGLLLSRTRSRFIDVAGTMALARWPMLFVALTGFFVHVPPYDPSNPLAAITPSVVAGGLVSLIFLIWMIALMYRAFTVSCNLKGGKAVGGFIGGLLLAEIFSKLVLHFTA